MSNIKSAFVNINFLYYYWSTFHDTEEGRKLKTRHSHHVSQRTAWWVLQYRDGGGLAEEGEHSLHVDEGLTHLPVHRPQEIKRQRELEQQTVHHHQISHRQVSWKKVIYYIHDVLTMKQIKYIIVTICTLS